MEITESKERDFLVLSVVGRLDANSINKFEETLIGKIEDGNKNVVIDLSDLEYISSSGLRVFLVGAKKLDEFDKKLNLCNVKEHIQEVFNITGFTPIFDFYDNLRSVTNK